MEQLEFFNLFKAPNSEGISLEEARAMLFKHLKEGTDCLCCNRFAKIWSRSLDSRMARALISLKKLTDLNVRKERFFFHTTEIRNSGKILDSLFRGGDFSKLEHWGFIFEMPKPEMKNSRTSGYWRITPAGIAFVNREIRVKSHVLIYDTKTIGFEGKDVSIVDCLGDHFNYQDLMSSQFEDNFNDDLHP